MVIDMQFVQTIFTSLLISVFTAWITVRFSLRQFYSQRWWERKAEAYTQILDSLYNVKHRMEWLIQEEERERIISDQQKVEINEKCKIGFAEINRLTNMGVFVFSKEIAEKVNHLGKELKKVHGL